MKKLGFTIVEILLIFAIGSVLVLFAARHYQRYLWQQQLETLNQSVLTLRQAFTQYYLQECKTYESGLAGTFIAVNYQNVLNTLPVEAQNSIKNPWLAAGQTIPFSLSVYFAEADRPQLVITTGSLRYPTQTVAPILNAQIVGNQLEWRWSPSYAALKEHGGSNLWIANAQGQIFSKTVNSETGGINSRFCKEYN